MARGLKFIPTPDQIEKDPLWVGFHSFARKIKLSHFFHKKATNRQGTERLFRENSSWEPDDKFIPLEILDELDKLKVKIGKINVISEKSNVSQDELQALKNLKNRHDLVFKKADKGNAIVIMQRDCYIHEALRQLSNTEYYQKIMAPVYPKTFNTINEIIGRLQNQRKLDSKQAKYLKPDENAKPRTFYLLPKIHKDREKWTIPNEMPPGRPIVSDCGSDNYRLSELIDFYLKPLACEHKSYIKDTNDFLEKIRDTKV